MASVMGIVVFVLKQYCNVPINGYLGQWINLIFYTLSGGVVYFSLTFLLKLKFTKLI